jgi:hypothetical protein
MNLIQPGEPCTQNSCITINDSIPRVKLTSAPMCKAVLGVISSSEDDTKRVWAAGNFVSNYEKVLGDSRLFINSGGEGAVWITNENGNLTNGEYITSSSTLGYGMRQDDDILHSYTLGKITMDCNFSPKLGRVKIYKSFDEKTQKIIWEYVVDPITGQPVYEPKYKCKTLPSGFKAAFVGVSYHCG